MNQLIALGIKLSGAGWVWDKIDGYKTKIAAAGLMLGGGGALLIGLGSLVAELVKCADLSCAIALGRNIKADPNWPNLVSGFQTFMGGLATLGIGHKLEKSSAVPAQAQP